MKSTVTEENYNNYMDFAVWFRKLSCDIRLNSAHFLQLLLQWICDTYRMEDKNVIHVYVWPINPVENEVNKYLIKPYITFFNPKDVKCNYMYIAWFILVKSFQYSIIWVPQKIPFLFVPLQSLLSTIIKQHTTNKCPNDDFFLLKKPNVFTT